MATIVVIEDNLSVLATISDTLTMVGYEVHLASHGHAGLELVYEHQPDLVLCDINMPKMNGFGVLQALRENPQTESLPFIFLTSRESREDRRRGMVLGADDYITKPFSPSELINAIATQLKKKVVIEKQKESTLRLLRRNVIYALPHELRTPLTMILGYSEIMINDLESFSQDEVRNMLQTMNKSGQRLHRLFENYLIYAQLELLEADPKAMIELRNNLTKNAATVIEEQAMEISEKYNRTNDLQLDLIRLTVPMSEENLKKIIVELMDNACKFSQPGTAIQISLAMDHNAYMIRVRDQGCGMTQEQIKSIGAYMQFERTLHEQQGVGLGLAITQRMTKLHAGKFNITSVVEQGTEVTLNLPF